MWGIRRAMSASLKSVVLVSVLAVAACAENAASPDRPAGGNADAAAPQAAPQPPAAEPDPAAPPEPSPRPAATAAAGQQSEDTALAPAAPVRSFADLVGKTGVQIRSAIGAPERLSEQPPARVWHYEFSGCSLELFLSPDVSSGAEKALSWSAKTREPDSSGIDPLCTRISADG